MIQMNIKGMNAALLSSLDEKVKRKNELTGKNMSRSAYVIDLVKKDLLMDDSEYKEQKIIDLLDEILKLQHLWLGPIKQMNLQFENQMEYAQELQTMLFQSLSHQSQIKKEV